VSQRRPLLPEQRVLPAPSLSESGSSRGCHASREHEPEPKPSRRQEPSQDSLPAWTSVRRGEHADDAAWRSSLPCLQPHCAATVPRTGRSRYRALPSEWLIIFVMLTDRVNHPLPPLLPFRAMKVSRCPVSRDLVHVSLELDQSSACLTQSGSARRCGPLRRLTEVGPKTCVVSSNLVRSPTRLTGCSYLDIWCSGNKQRRPR
jgi:hypothetical protein